MIGRVARSPTTPCVCHNEFRFKTYVADPILARWAVRSLGRRPAMRARSTMPPEVKDNSRMTSDIALARAGAGPAPDLTP